MCKKRNSTHPTGRSVVILPSVLQLSLWWYIAMVRNHPCELNRVCASTTAESRSKIWYQYNAHKTPMALAAVRSKAVLVLLIIRCWLLLPLWESVIVLCFCCELLYVYSSFAIIPIGRESWLLCSVCLPGVSWLLCVSSLRYQGCFCSLWLWYFLGEGLF